MVYEFLQNLWFVVKVVSALAMCLLAPSAIAFAAAVAVSLAMNRRAEFGEDGIAAKIAVIVWWAVFWPTLAAFLMTVIQAAF